MEPVDFTKYLILSILVTAWCVVHSAVISISVTGYFKRLLGSNYRFYRLFFNLIAILTLIPVAFFAYSLRTQVLLQWNGYMRVGQVLILGIAAVLFFLGGRHYNIRQLLGIQQIKDGTSSKAITGSGELDTSGILKVTRHPWYLAAILLIWARNLDVSAILVNVILTSYLIFGTCLEEKKLVMEFGEKYLAYQKRVSMLIPFRWLKWKIVDLQGPPDHANSGDSGKG